MDRSDRKGLWTVLRLYGVGGRLLKGVKRSYVNIRACVRVGNGVSDWCPVRVGFRHGCERCKAKRKTSNGMARQCEESVRCKRDVC